MAQDLDDDQLMIRGAHGDRAALGVLVSRWEKRVFAFLYSMLGSREEAQDVAQEAFLRMCQNASRYQPKGQFRSWLFRIAGNQARSRLRRRKLVRWVGLEPARDERPIRVDRPDARLERDEARAQVERALAALPPRQREAIVLRRFQDMSYREIAETMQSTVSAVETLLHRAMKSLSRELGSGEERS